MRGLPGFLGGVLALVALQTVVAYAGPSQRLQQLVGGNGFFVKAARRFLDPTIPAIPERTSSSKTPSAKPAAVTSYPAPTVLA